MVSQHNRQDYTKLFSQSDQPLASLPFSEPPAHH